MLGEGRVCYGFIALWQAFCEALFQFMVMSGQADGRQERDAGATSGLRNEDGLHLCSRLSPLFPVALDACPVVLCRFEKTFLQLPVFSGAQLGWRRFFERTDAHWTAFCFVNLA